jgi:CDP-diacylglycerol--glycerol-3-phosphate 3-phosphatidyltransferase
MIRIINLLTISRIVIAIIIFFLLTFDNYFGLALVLFLMAGLTDYLDGYLARRYQASSQIGEILDPIADKILIIFLLFGLAVNLSSYLVAFAGAFIIAREIWVSALRDYNSRVNNTNATKVIYIAKIKTTIQIFTIFVYLLALAFNIMLLIPIADILIVISLIVTIYSGYIYTLNTFKN